MLKSKVDNIFADLVRDAVPDGLGTWGTIGKGIDATMALLRPDPEYQELKRRMAACLRSRHSQYLLPFSFWPEVYQR